MTAWNTLPGRDEGMVDLYLGDPEDAGIHILSGMYAGQARILVEQHEIALRAATKRGAMPPAAVEAMLARVLAAALRELGWGLVPPTIRRRVRRPATKKENNRVP